VIHFTLIVIIVNAPGQTIQEQPIVQEQPPMPRDRDLNYVTCETCGWQSGYESMSSAKMGLGAHRGWCKRGRGKRSNLFGKPS
jgi:hypothetical protein